MIAASPSLALRPARPADARDFADHVAAHMAESGRGGSHHFAIARAIDPEEVRESAKARWSRPLDEPLWARAWLLSTEPSVFDRARPGCVVGHLELRGGRVPAELHRAVLAMGIQRPFTGQGHGRRLMDAAIAWARDVAHLSWIDLGVFANNEPARRLYARVGFVEVGVQRDAFRVDDGVSVDDVHMTLPL